MAGFEKTSPIQDLTLDAILGGEDIFAQAETGSGKTAAFVIPIIEQILRVGRESNLKPEETPYVVLSPTRELAQQTERVFLQFGKEIGVRTCCVIGGESIERQKSIVASGVHVLVATPGRLTDLIKQRVVDLRKCKSVVFDEADRLFDMGFKDDIEFILSKINKDRQLIMLSATSNQEVLRTAYKFNSHPREIIINEDSLLVDHIDHQLAMISREEKFPLLVNILQQHEDAYALVFCNTQLQTHVVAEWLLAMNFKAKPICGRLPQNKRTQIMAEFRSKKVKILVCTDLAARGLDIKKVNLVINYDLPQESVNYVHRIGRTGRAGEAGQAISFCAHEDCEFLEGIYTLIGEKIPVMDLNDDDFATNICRKPYIDRKTLRVVQPRTEQPQRKRRDNKSNSENNSEKNRKKRPEYNKRMREERMEVSSEISNKDQTASRIDKRFFTFNSFEKDSAIKAAMEYLRVEDESLLEHEITGQGSRKFLFFGPRETSYKFSVKPIYKKLLLPFLIEVTKKAQLNLYIKVSFKEPHLRITFSGKDESLLLNNNSELLYAFEHIIKLSLYQRVTLHKGIKISVKCFNDSKKQEDGLIRLADKMKTKVIERKKPVLLNPLSPADRRIIHLHLEKDSRVKTASIGSGHYKKIEISLI